MTTQTRAREILAAEYDATGFASHDRTASRLRDGQPEVILDHARALRAIETALRSERAEIVAWLREKARKERSFIDSLKPFADAWEMVASMIEHRNHLSPEREGQ